MFSCTEPDGSPVASPPPTSTSSTTRFASIIRGKGSCIPPINNDNYIEIIIGDIGANLETEEGDAGTGIDNGNTAIIVVVFVVVGLLFLGLGVCIQQSQ